MPKETKAIFVKTFLMAIVMLGIVSGYGLVTGSEPSSLTEVKPVEEVSIETYDKLVENNVIDNSEENLTYKSDRLVSFEIKGTNRTISIVDTEKSKEEINDEYKSVLDTINEVDKNVNTDKYIKYALIIAAFVIVVVLYIFN